MILNNNAYKQTLLLDKEKSLQRKPLREKGRKKIEPPKKKAAAAKKKAKWPETKLHTII